MRCPDLVEVLVLSMVDMSRAKASATRLLELDTSSVAVVSSYSSGSTPDRDRKQPGFYCGINRKCGQQSALKPPAVFVASGSVSGLNPENLNQTTVTEA